jgi:hypothetical protein
MSLIIIILLIIPGGIPILMIGSFIHGVCNTLISKQKSETKYEKYSLYNLGTKITAECLDKIRILK